MPSFSMRLTNTRPYLSAGYALPDMIVFNSDVAKVPGKGLKLAGFFGPDWGVESGVFLREGDLPLVPPAKTAEIKR